MDEEKKDPAKKNEETPGAILFYALNGPPMALTWDSQADRILETHQEYLVIILPDRDEAMDFARDLSGSVTGPGPRSIRPTAADQWRGTREDAPRAALACIRYVDESAACPDVLRYRSLMEALGMQSII